MYGCIKAVNIKRGLYHPIKGLSSDDSDMLLSSWVLEMPEIDNESAGIECRPVILSGTL